MTLQKATNFLETLKTERTKKYEIKIYEKFLHILTEMKIRQLYPIEYTSQLDKGTMSIVIVNYNGIVITQIKRIK